jgi:hypothetical protein
MSEKFDIYSKIFFRDVGNFFRYLCELVLRHQMWVSNYFVNSFYSAWSKGLESSVKSMSKNSISGCNGTNVFFLSVVFTPPPPQCLVHICHLSTLNQHCIAGAGLSIRMIEEVSWDPKRRRSWAS